MTQRVTEGLTRPQLASPGVSGITSVRRSLWHTNIRQILTFPDF